MHYANVHSRACALQASSSSAVTGQYSIPEKLLCITLHIADGTRFRARFRSPMQAAELLLVLGGLAAAVGALIRPGRWFGLLAAAGVAMQVFVHGPIWQAAPAYFAALLLLLAGSCRQVAGPALLLTLGSAVALAVMPLFRLPAPTGPYIVGTTLLHLVDERRADATFHSGRRELMVQLWYPAAARTAHRAPYRRARETTLLSSYDRRLRTNSWTDAPLLDNMRLPLILFNPGWASQRTQYTALLEDLASHGYAVASIDHTHNAGIVLFPGGQVVTGRGALPIDDFEGMTPESATRRAAPELDTQTLDDVLVLNSLERSAPWSEVIDFDRIGAMGHSFGGAVAVAAAARDPRIRAAVNMDGLLFGALHSAPPGKPVMMMSGNGWPFSAADVERERHSAYPGDQLDVQDLDAIRQVIAASGGYLLSIRHARHMDFSDRGLYSPLRRLTECGTIQAEHAIAIIRAYSLAFFDQTLREKSPPLLREPPSDAEVQWTGAARPR